MSLTRNILRSYRAPRRVMRDLLAADLREPQVLFFGTLACALIFVAQWPGLQRAAMLDPSTTFEQRMGAVLFATMFLLPLVLYGVAGLLQLGLRVGRARVPGLWVRAAFFWSLLSVTPLMLAQAALSLAHVAAGRAFGLVVLGFFLYILTQAVREVVARAKAGKGTI
jgi:hypothetical protein